MIFLSFRLLDALAAADKTLALFSFHASGCFLSSPRCVSSQLIFEQDVFVLDLLLQEQIQKL